MNRELRTRLSLLRPNRDSTVLDKQATQKSSHDHRAHDREFVVGDRVFARNLRAGPEWVLSTVVEVLGPVTYIIETDEGLRWKRHANQLKDFLSRSLTTSGDVSGNTSGTVNDEFPVELPSDSEEEIAAEVTEPQVEESEAHTESTSPPNPDTSHPRYPQRDRHPPDRYA